MPARRYLVSGLVQGVGFRWFVGRHAERLGVTGFARNLADGRVEVVAAGSETALDALETELRRGPAGARVDDLARSEASEADAGTDGFRTRRA